MRCQWLMFLLFVGLAYGQAAPKPAGAGSPSSAPKSTSAPEAKPAEVTVSPDDPVITLKGFCDDPSKQGDACKTVVTREQFEKMADALQPGMSPAVRRQLANAYSRMLLMSTAAEKRGLDKKPQFDQMMRFARMQILSQSVGRDLQEETSKVSDSDIEKYYNDNKSSYETATLQRIFVPRVKQIAASKPEAKEAELEAQEKAGEAAMKKMGIDLQARADKGEDFDKLQKEAFLAAGMKGTPPSTKMEKVRQATLPPAQKVAFQLKPGAVSELISDPSGHYIYKLVSKDVMALDAVKPEIHNAIAAQRYRDAMAPFNIGPNLDMNEAYFGPSKNPAAQPPQPGGKSREGGEVDPD